MELLWKEENICVLQKRESVRLDVEGEVPLPEGKHAQTLLAAKSTLESCTCTIQGEGVQLGGVVLLSLLCQDDAGLFAFSSRASFTQLYEADATDCRCCCCLSTPSVKLGESDGALHFSCAIEADLLLLRNERVRALNGIDGLAQNDLQCRSRTLSSTRRVAGETQKMRLREEIASPNISEVIASLGHFQLRDSPPGEDARLGTLSLSLLLRDKDDHLFESIEHVPVRLDAERGSMDEKIGDCELSGLSVRSVGEEFGILSVEAELRISPYRHEKQSCVLPLDAYAPSIPFKCGFSELCAFSDVDTLRFSSSFDALLNVPEGLPEIAVPIFSCVQSAVTAAAVENGKLYVEGVLETRVVYKSANGSYYAFTDEVPFTAECAASEADLIQVDVRALSRVSGTGRSAQLQIILLFTASLCQSETLQVVSGISECEKTSRPSGIVVLFSGEGETLFDIAKEYNTTVDALRALEPSLQEPLTEGSPILMLV